MGISFAGPGTRTRQSFDRSLNELSGILQAMGNDVVQALNQALLVWQTDDLDLAREVVSSDYRICLLYTSDAADERSSVDLGGRRIIKNKKTGCIMGREKNQL